MNCEENVHKTIYMGYHPRTHDGSSPQSRSLSDSIAVMDAFNQKQVAGKLRAEVVEIACSDLCAVAVMKISIDKVWQYI